MKTVSQCRNLREYREDVLGLPQAEVARRAKRHQAWISYVERGHLPRKWNQENLLKAYELEMAQFERLVTGAKSKPFADELPLWASTKIHEPGLTPESLKLLVEVMRKVGGE